MKLADKKICYGDAIVRVGGAAPEEDLDLEVQDEQDPGDCADDASLVPFCWWSYPKLFWANMLDALSVSAAIDFTPGDGQCALAAIERKALYLGFTFNEHHALALHSHLVDCVLAALQTEGNPLYVVDCAKELKGMKGTEDSADCGANSEG